MSANFIGCKISLISKSEIRYEGILYTIDTNDSTIALAQVKSYGTENRKCDKPCPARPDVYEYIVFRASDIKDLLVDEQPSASMPNDPAIIQSQSSIGPQKHFPTAPSPTPQPSKSNVTVRISRGPSPARTKSPAFSDTRSAGDHGKKSNQNQNQNQNRRNQPQQGSFNGFNRGGYGNRMNYGNNQGYGNQQYGNQRRSDWPQSGQGYQRQQSGPQMRPNNIPPRVQAGPVDVKKVEEFDYEKEHRNNEEVFKNMTISSDKPAPVEAAIKEEPAKETYDKEKSFFDCISCDALSRGTDHRIDRKTERNTNKETFGEAGIKRFGYGRGRGGYGNSYRGRPTGYHSNQGGYRNYQSNTTGNGANRGNRGGNQ